MISKLICSRRGVILSLLLLCTNHCAVAQDKVLITEFMANNASILADEDGDFSDWIEIHNAGSDTVDLLDWSLTDNASSLTQWRFPSTNIPPGGFLVVFASQKDR